MYLDTTCLRLLKKVYKSMLREFLYEQKCLDKLRQNCEFHSQLNSYIKVPFLPDLLTLIWFSVSLLLTVSFARCRKTYLKKMLTLKKIHIFSSLYTQLFSAISQVDKLAQVKNSSGSFYFYFFGGEGGVGVMLRAFFFEVTPVLDSCDCCRIS